MVVTVVVTMLMMTMAEILNDVLCSIGRQPKGLQQIGNIPMLNLDSSSKDLFLTLVTVSTQEIGLHVQVCKPQNPISLTHMRKQAKFTNTCTTYLTRKTMFNEIIQSNRNKHKLTDITFP